MCGLSFVGWERQWSPPGEMALERKLERHQGTALSPCPAAQPGQQHWEESEAPAPFSALFFTRACVPAAVAVWVALGSLCCGGRGGLSPWARMRTLAWMSGVSYSSLLARQGLEAAHQLADSGNPNRNMIGSRLFFQIFFLPADGDVYRQTKQSCSFLRGHPGKRDMCATIYHETPHTRDTWDTALKGCICPL